MTEPMTKFSCEMGVVAEATGVGDFAERLTSTQQRPTMQKMRGVFQTMRIDEFTAGRPVLREELLQITQRDPRFGCRVARSKIRIGKAVADDPADTSEQLVGVARDRRWVGWCKECADEIIDRQLHVGIGGRIRRSVTDLPNDIEEQTPGRRSGPPVKTALWLEPEMGNEG